MPEGHTVHRAAERQTALLAGRAVRASSPQGRFADGAEELDGLRLEEIDAVGKHLFYRFTGDRLLHVHLGLFGRFRTHAAAPVPEPRGAVRLRLATDDRALDLSGPIVCALIDEEDRARVLDRLGPDPLRPDADPERARAALARRRQPIGAALLDQSVIAGLGNVYRAEALFVCGIDPHRPARDLSGPPFDALWQVLGRMLRDGVRRGRIVTVDPAELGRPPSRARRNERTYVYRQGRCRRCGDAVAAPVIGGRPCYWCPTCQS